MSRIGNLPIQVPEGVKIKVTEDNVVIVTGKLGELSRNVHPTIRIHLENDQITLSRETESKSDKAYHGLYRALIANMIKGVSAGYTIQQEVVGVGYKAEAKGQTIEMSLGYSHNIVFVLPPEVKATTVTERGKNPLITLTSHDNQLLGQVAAKIRSLRKPEPYKGKGILFKGEVIRKKAGKSASEK